MARGHGLTVRVHDAHRKPVDGAYPVNCFNMSLSHQQPMGALPEQHTSLYDSGRIEHCVSERESGRSAAW